MLKLLQRHTILQKDNEVWEKLENLLNNSSQGIKKEILKLLEIDNHNLLNYLIEMYDDESADIRHFVYEKLSEIKNFDMIDPKIKVKLLYVGLSDLNNKVQQSAKKFLKNYLYSLGIYKSKKLSEKSEDVKMEVDIEEEVNTKEKEANKENAKIGKKKRGKKSKIKEENSDSSEAEQDSDDDRDEYDTAHDKIIKSESPLKVNKKKLVDAPSRVLDKLDIVSYYNHPKYSCTFQLITEAIIEFTDHTTLSDFYKNIIDNMILVSNSQAEIKFLSSEKKKKHSGGFNSTEGKVDKYALFNDVYFLQNSLSYISGKQDEASQALKTQLYEMIPDSKTFSKIMNYFYKKEPNILILHQLFLIGLRLVYEDEIGNREMSSFIKLFVSDIDLHRVKLTDLSFRKLHFENLNTMYTQPEELNENDNQAYTEQLLIKNSVENMLLPYSRRIVLNMEDLVDYALKILLKINANQHTQLFTSIMELIQEINEPLESDPDSDNLSTLKGEQRALIEKIKEKMAFIGELEQKKKRDKSSRIEIDRKLLKEQEEMEKLEDDLFSVSEKEKHILLKKLKLCEFLIKYCKVNVGVFEQMVNDIILTSIQRKEYPEVMRISFNSMGLLAINHFNSNYKNYLKLFFDQIEKRPNHAEDSFREFEKTSLNIIFDSILCNNLNDFFTIPSAIDEKIDLIIKKYLYHPDNNAKVIAFTGLCKLLIANRITKPELILSRLLIILHNTLDTDMSTNRKDEDYNIKIFEVMQNFLYAYCVSNKNNIKSIINALLIALTSKMISDSIGNYEKSVVNDFCDIKYDFVKQLISLVNEFSMGRGSVKKIVFKIFKYMYFLFGYTCGDVEKNIENNEEIKTAKFTVKYKNKQNLRTNLKKFFEKTKFDLFLLNEANSSESFYMKLFPFILKLNDYSALKTISENCLGSHLDSVKENNFVVNFPNGAMDFSNEEKQNELKDYVENKTNKYYKTIEEYWTFIESLKEDKLYAILEENSGIEEDEANEINNNISEASSKNKSRGGMIKEEIEEEKGKV